MPIIGAFVVPHPPLIIPEIGRSEEKKISNTVSSYKEVASRIKTLEPDTLIIASPHSIMYADYIHISPGAHAEGDFGQFGAPKIKASVDYDPQLIEKISDKAGLEGIRAGTLGARKPNLDHGTMVPLYFINQVMSKYKIVRIGISGLSYLDHYRMGIAMAKSTDELNRRVVFVASGDLSHKLKADGPYGFAPEGPDFDAMITNVLKSGNFADMLRFDESFCEKAAECGLRSFIMMAGALDGLSVKPELLSYEGPFGVGYAVAAYTVLGEDPERLFLKQYLEQDNIELEKYRSNEDPYVELARSSLEYYLINNKRMRLPVDIDKELLSEQSGVFVSLKLDGRLRGCIGTIEPSTENIAKEIIQNAISAGTRDPRFEPVTLKEMKRLVYSVDVLKPAEPIRTLSELDPLRYGVIVSNGDRQGLLLPNLEGINTPEEQVKIALRKAGIPETSNYQMERFEVIRHH
ncbi:MAG: AmmeMemoRadiSam system protein A [Bacilli bacterium]|nr:AmmeMemoRadiSam system protein A [Bacilli bacterium]MBN2696151.1 AmmeMemoRadiSam system protein A [Bacilli bacterium]